MSMKTAELTQTETNWKSLADLGQSQWGPLRDKRLAFIRRIQADALRHAAKKMDSLGSRDAIFERLNTEADALDPKEGK